MIPFNAIDLPIWLLDESYELVDVTQAAMRLTQHYQLTLYDIKEICKGNITQKEDIHPMCITCPINRIIFSEGFSLILKHCDGNFVDFWGKVTRSDNGYMVQLREKLNPDVTQNSRRLLRHLNEAREDERKKIAQDLHDGIAQSVFSLMLEVRSLKWLKKDQQRDKIAEIDAHFAESLQEIRNLARDLHPITLNEMGVVHAVREWVNRNNSMTGFETQLEVIGQEPQLSDLLKLSVFRMIQEGVQNSMKYSGEQLNYVQIKFNDTDISMTIEDQGVGFELALHQTGFGLLNMQERVASLNGGIQIMTAPNAGTRLLIKIPID